MFLKPYPHAHPFPFWKQHAMLYPCVTLQAIRAEKSPLTHSRQKRESFLQFFTLESLRMLFHSEPKSGLPQSQHSFSHWKLYCCTSVRKRLSLQLSRHLYCCGSASERSGNRYLSGLQWGWQELYSLDDV